MSAWRRLQSSSLLGGLRNLTAALEARCSSSGPDKDKKCRDADQEERINEATREVLSRL